MTPPQTPLRLQVSGEDGQGIELPKSGMLVIGSSKDRAGFVVDGQGIDPAHCAVGRTKRGGWAIKDLGSKYGTLVNGESITSTRLRQGDVITLGSRLIEVRNPSDAPTQIAEPGKTPEPMPIEETREVDATPEPKSRLAEAVKEKASVPARIGGYRIDRPLGRGGMGAVYLALQESLNRPVALKVLARRLADNADFVERFQSEARAAAALNHPNVVVVYDVGESAGHHYLSMEFMPGGSLEQRLAAAGPLPWRQVLDALHDAAGGLRYAESKGIIHRDIKPANLMLTGTGTVKIADLGLATTVDAEAENVDGRKILGTPHFISPEQARGEAVDHRSDLYSLGATAYRLLTGRTPFEGETTRDILLAHLQDRPTPPSELVPGLPSELEDVVAKLMEKRPDDRFSSADELRLVLDRLRLRADHGESFDAGNRGGQKTLLVAVAALGVIGLGAAAFFLAGSGEKPDEDGGVNAATSRGTVDVPPVADEDPDPDFFENSDPTPPESEGADEEQLELRELKAERDYLRIQKDLPRDQRIAELEALVEQYEGTTIAARALAEIDDLQGSLTKERLASAQLEVKLDNAMGALRTALDWPPAEGELPDPAQTLRRLRAHEAPAEIASSPEWTSRRRALLAEILRESASGIEAALERADRRAEAGAFEEVRELLQGLIARLDLPEATEEDRDGIAQLSVLGSEVRQRLAALPEREKTFAIERTLRERQTVSARLGKDSGLGEEIRALDLDAVDARLGTLAAELGATGLPQRALTLQSDVASARTALDGLIAEFQEDGWRRRSVMDVRARRRSAREVLGVNRAGITLEVDGQRELVSWDDVEADADWIGQLFKGRIERDYTPMEQRGILALMRFAAAGKVTDLALQMLDPGNAGKLQRNEIEEIRQALEGAEEWLADHPNTPPEEVERVAADKAALALLANALEAADQERWSASATLLERLLTAHPEALFVVLLSDGTAY